MLKLVLNPAGTIDPTPTLCNILSPNTIRVKELFHFLCRYSDFVRAHTFFSHNSHVSESISKILFSSESLAWQLSEEKKILKIGSETRELWANLHRQFLHFLKFLLFSTIFHRGLRTNKIGVTAQKMQYLRNPCSDFQNLFFPWKLRCSAFRGMLCILSIFSRTRDIGSQSFLQIVIHDPVCIIMLRCLTRASFYT